MQLVYLPQLGSIPLHAPMLHLLSILPIIIPAVHMNVATVPSGLRGNGGSKLKSYEIVPPLIGDSSGHPPKEIWRRNIVCLSENKFVTSHRKGHGLICEGRLFMLYTHLTHIASTKYVWHTHTHTHTTLETKDGDSV